MINIMKTKIITMMAIVITAMTYAQTEQTPEDLALYHPQFEIAESEEVGKKSEFAKFFTRPQIERWTVSHFFDVQASIKESGYNFGVRTGYEGVIYAKIEIESFNALEGGFTSFGSRIGKIFEQKAPAGQSWSEYIGIRLTPLVYRTNPQTGKTNRRENWGFEAGIDWRPFPRNQRWAFGLIGAYDWRQDMEIIDSGTAIWRFSGYGTIKYTLANLK